MASQHSDAVKAEAIAMLLTGATVAAVARKFNVGRGTIRNWRALAGVGPAMVAPKQKEALGELIAKYLRAGLRALEAHALATSDPAWIARQDADKLAILHGVLADKLVGILSGLESNAAEPD